MNDWRESLRLATVRPSMFIGSQENGHTLAILEVLRVVFEAMAFNHPLSASVILSPLQYSVCCKTGPLLTEIDQLIDWTNHLVIIDALGELRQKLRGKPHNNNWQRSFTGPNDPDLVRATRPLYLAKSFIVAIKTDSGFWCQTFKHGWPESKPFQSEIMSPIGLLVTGTLDPKWFTCLPFTHAHILAAIPEAFRRCVTVDWHPDNDLLDDSSMLSKNIARILATE